LLTCQKRGNAIFNFWICRQRRRVGHDGSFILALTPTTIDVDSFTQAKRTMKVALCLLLPAVVSAFTTTRSHGRRALSSLSAIKESTFGMGCFWEPSEALLKVDGVVDTVAGYTGNPSATKAPSYENVCFGREWVEGVRVTYDDEKLSYQELLEAFFEAQKPIVASRQYASIIFPHDDEQQKIASEWIQSNTKRQSKDGWKPEWTAIESKTKFYQAEGYHQRYWQKQRPRFAAIIALLAVATGVLDPIVPEVFQQKVSTGGNALVIALGLFITAERWFDAKVVEL
jgi:peptide-methionine (S)-S-oxide reductase